MVQKSWALNAHRTRAFLRGKNVKLLFFADFSFVGPFPDLDWVQLWGLDARFPGFLVDLSLCLTLRLVETETAFVSVLSQHLFP